MYQVLARKWRPKNFHQLVGQTHVAQALTYALDHNKIHHAYLFTGTRGVGKTTIARIFAKSLNCLMKNISSEPCGECQHCLEIDEGRFPDLIEVDAASRTGVDDTRELLDNVPYAPVKGRFKVYLIDEVHMFSRSSFNALLKTLEEPPEHVKFILATTDPQKLPATILSRCLQFHLKNMTEGQIAGHLAQVLQQENAEFETEALHLLANAAAGSMRDSLSLLDQALAYGQGKITVSDVSTLLGAVSSQQLLHLLQAIVSGKGQNVRQILLQLDQYSPDYAALLQNLLQLFQKITIIQLDAELPEDNISPPLRKIAEQLPVELIQLWYQIATDAWQNLPYQPDTRLALEMTLLRMMALQPAHPLLQEKNIRAVPSAKMLPAENNAENLGSELETGSGRADLEPENNNPEQETGSGRADLESENNNPEFARSFHDESDIPPWLPLPEQDVNNQQPKTLENQPPSPHFSEGSSAENETSLARDVLIPEEKLLSFLNQVENWSAGLRDFSLTQNALSFLENCLPYQWENSVLSLYYGEEAELFNHENTRAAVVNALSEWLGRSCDIRLTFRDEIDTPRKFRDLQIRQHQQEVEKNFLAHPHVVAAQAVFANEIFINDIEPLKE